MKPHAEPATRVPLSIAPTTPRANWPGFVGVDEGLDQLFRWTHSGDRILWTVPLASKCRTLQPVSNSCVLGAQDRGYFEADVIHGVVLRHVTLEQGGVIAAARRSNGHTFLAGINLAGRRGVSFVEYDAADILQRVVAFAGDYVRGATLTAEDTILFTNNDRVLEGDWSGRVLREFAAPGFKHAWKAVRLPNDHTVISAGYGAFVVEFDPTGREVRRWHCAGVHSGVRPHFFGDFVFLRDGSLLVCNWLGHGRGLGGTGCALLHFDATGVLAGTWQDAERTSSVQTFVLTDGPIAR